jgi:hypothetical protein
MVASADSPSRPQIVICASIVDVSKRTFTRRRGSWKTNQRAYARHLD